MIDSGDAKDVIIKVMDTEPKNRNENLESQEQTNLL
jgi:hypothetical protein